MSTTHAQNSDEDDDRANVARLTSIEGRGRSGLMPELAVAFHAELGEDARLHLMFLARVRAVASQRATRTG